MLLLLRVAVSAAVTVVVVVVLVLVLVRELRLQYSTVTNECRRTRRYLTHRLAMPRSPPCLVLHLPNYLTLPNSFN